MATSIFERKRDLVYLIYFCISVPITFIVDLQAIYPAHLIPTFMSNITKFYLDTYNDLFFINNPPFFQAFMWSELLYQAPTGIWAISNLLKGHSVHPTTGYHGKLADLRFQDSPKVPLVLLPFSLVIFLTTGTCIVEYLAWHVPVQQKIDMTTLYGPYLLLSMFMGLDMYSRLNAVVEKASAIKFSVSSKKIT